MNDSEQLDSEDVATQEAQLYDMNAVTPVDHTYNKIVGNQLMCSQHNGLCPVITIKPTQVLEYDDKGVLQLIDKG